MSMPPDVVFHRYFQQLSPFRKQAYRGKMDLDHVEEPKRGLFLAIQANLNEALNNEWQDVPEHVAHPPFHFDYIDSDHANALAFTYETYSFIGITIRLIDRMWEACLPITRSAEVATMLGLRLDTEARRTTLHAILLRTQLAFVAAHEYTHIVHGHTRNSAKGPRFVEEIDAVSAGSNMDSQVCEVDADSYAAYHVLWNLFAGERELVDNLHGTSEAGSQARDRLALALFVVGVGSFLFLRPARALTPNNVYSESHPPQAARMNYIMEAALNWCRQNRPDLAEWMTPGVFSQLMNAVASTAGAGGDRGWLSQTEFLKTQPGDRYIRALGEGVQNYIRNL